MPEKSEVIAFLKDFDKRREDAFSEYLANDKGKIVELAVKEDFISGYEPYETFEGVVGYSRINKFEAELTYLGQRFLEENT